MSKTHNKSKAKKKCPFCSKTDTRENLVSHIEDNHEDMIPENYSAARVLYNYINKKDKGRCVVCGKETPWDENTWKYKRLCGREECSKKLRENYRKNMINKLGTDNILNDPDQQMKMLANRKISGQYKFKDGGIHTYTGSYEKATLKFFDEVMNVSSDEVLSPGPVLQYEFNGKKLSWITDIYYITANLVIEVKDGGDNPNNRPMQEYRDKQVAKEKAIAEDGRYNYIRLTNNNFGQLIYVLSELKRRMMNDSNIVDPLIQINESYSDIPEKFDSLFVVRCKNNEYENFIYGYTDNIDMINIQMPNEDELLTIHELKKKYSIVEIYQCIDRNTKKDTTYDKICENGILSDNQIEYDTRFRRFIPLSEYNEINRDIIYSSIKAMLSNSKNLYIDRFNTIDEFSVYEDINGLFLYNKDNDLRTKSYSSIMELTDEKLLTSFRLLCEYYN